MTATSTNTQQKLIQDVALQAIPEAVLQKSLNRPLGTVRLTRLYAVPSGWETQELKKAGNIVVASTADAFEAALNAGDGREIVLLKSAGYTLDSVAARLQTQGGSKVIFIES